MDAKTSSWDLHPDGRSFAVEAVPEVVAEDRPPRDFVIANWLTAVDSIMAVNR